MQIECVTSGECAAPFPLYRGLVDTLLDAHVAAVDDADPVAAHVLATCAGYAYADAPTVSMMMQSLGIESNACARVSQTVDAMMIFSTAFVVQSRCGRLVFVAFRGTEPANLGNWLADADVGGESSALTNERAAEGLRVHAGFHRNLRAVWLGVIDRVAIALQGRSIADPGVHVGTPMQALYVAGHSLGGAMAQLFALSILGRGTTASIAERLRAVYTFGQPMAVCRPVPAWAEQLRDRMFIHVLASDLVPALPPAAWGPFTHLGRTYRHDRGAWRRAESHVEPIASVREIPKALLAALARDPSRASYRYSLARHPPQHYIDALRPAGMTSEFGI
jgi:hypothetical protein